jgi:Rod binding domain-containing protein
MGGITLDPILTGTADKDLSQKRLKGICAEFESIFITHMLKSMRKTVIETGLLGNTNESKIYQSMFDEKLAIQISRSGGMGFGEILFERLKDENLGASPQTPRPSRHEIDI